MNIEELDLSYNSISSELPFMRLYTLRVLDLTGNPLTSAQVDTIRSSLVDCEVIF